MIFSLLHKVYFGFVSHIHLLSPFPRNHPLPLFSLNLPHPSTHNPLNLRFRPKLRKYSHEITLFLTWQKKSIPNLKSHSRRLNDLSNYRTSDARKMGAGGGARKFELSCFLITHLQRLNPQLSPAKCLFQFWGAGKPKPLFEYPFYLLISRNEFLAISSGPPNSLIKTLILRLNSIPIARLHFGECSDPKTRPTNKFPWAPSPMKAKRSQWLIQKILIFHLFTRFLVG